MPNTNMPKYSFRSIGRQIFYSIANCESSSSAPSRQTVAQNLCKEVFKSQFGVLDVNKDSEDPIESTNNAIQKDESTLIDDQCSCSTSIKPHKKNYRQVLQESIGTTYSIETIYPPKNNTAQSVSIQTMDMNKKCFRDIGINTCLCSKRHESTSGNTGTVEYKDESFCNCESKELNDSHEESSIDVSFDMFLRPEKNRRHVQREKQKRVQVEKRNKDCYKSTDTHIRSETCFRKETKCFSLGTVHQRLFNYENNRTMLFGGYRVPVCKRLMSRM